MSEIVVREYRPEDREAVEKCIFELQEDERAREPHTWAEPSEVLHTYLDYAIKSASTQEGAVFVAELDNKTIGYVVVVISTEDDSPAVSLKNFAYVMDLAVLREYKGQGAGRELMRKAEEYGKSKNMEWMQLDVTKSNPALDFYTKCGYVEKSIRLEKNLNK